MPSPVGHALGGFAVGWLVTRSSRLDRPLLAAVIFAALGVIADADLVFPGTHRLYSHSIGAVGLVGLLAALSLRAAGRRVSEPADRLLLVVAAAAAYASHVLLDWMADDGSPPLGICALWPFSNTFFQSDLHLFPPVERRYWLPIFWTRNLHALGRELLVLAPLALFALFVHRPRATTR
jgi:membrane-bound metal-dependent hydrolase YbcI (DUF457 family)